MLFVQGAAPPVRAAKGSADGLADDVAVKAAGALAGVARAKGRADVAVSLRPRDAATAHLAETLEALVVGRLRAMAPGEDAVRTVDALVGADLTTARRAGYEYWLDAELVVGNGRVEVLGRLVTAGGNLWAETAGRAGGDAVVSATYASAKLDAELRALLAAPATKQPDAKQPDAKQPDPQQKQPDAKQPDAKQPDPQQKQPALTRTWSRPRRVEIDLGAPLLALAAGDLDGDGTAELVALTTDELVVLGPRKNGADIRQRVSLTGAAPVPFPRDPVGAVVVSGDTVVARASTHADALQLVFTDGALVPVRAAPRLGGYPLAALRDDAGTVHVGTATLARGMNYFLGPSFAVAPAWAGGAPKLPERVLAAAALLLQRADDTMVLILGAVNTTGALTLTRAGETAPFATVADAGAAFALADLDLDGRVDLVTSAWRAPGDGDQLSVRAIHDDGTVKARYQGDALRGGIVGIAAADYNGDGAPDVAAAARLPGSTRIDIWVLD